MASTVPLVTRPTPVEERIIEFKGLNRKHFVEEGEMSEMKNLTSDRYPLLCPRKLRGELPLPEGVKMPWSVITKYERIFMIAQKSDDSYALFYATWDDDEGEWVWAEISAVTGLTADTEMVAINTKICFFPQKTYLTLVRSSNSVTIGSYKHLDNTIATTADSPYWAVTITSDGTEVLVPTGHGFVKNDGVTITGFLTYNVGGTPQTPKNLNVSCLIQDIKTSSTPGYVKLILPRETFIELTSESATDVRIQGVTDLISGEHSPAKISRSVPDMVHVIEWNNRLWGACNSDNTIYACKLGDPTNWQYYQGTSLDSYYAQQGTDENWTGSAAYSGHLIFFKQNSMTKIYGTSPASFQITNTVCYGVEQGSSKSVAIINDKVFYKSTIGIMAYEGGTPYCISEKLGNISGKVVAGTEGIKYYASIQTEVYVPVQGVTISSELMVLDIDKAVWHKEDGVAFRDCCTLNGKLYFICDADYDEYEGEHIYIINPETETETKMQRDWMAVFGPFDEYVEDQKIYSKMSLRFIASPYTRVNVYIKMNDEEWETVKRFEFAETGGATIPIVPRRCDRFSIKVTGTGDCEIKSLTRRFRRGSGVKP